MWNYYHSWNSVVLILLISSSSSSSSNSKTAQACTVFIVGKDASTDGSVLVSHSNDGEFDTDPRLVKVPSRQYQQGSQRPVYFSPESYPRYVGTARGIPEYFPQAGQEDFVPLGYIDQTTTATFSYLEETYGAVNEHQVGIGESTCSGVFGAVPLGAPNGTALLSVDELTQLSMERASTAREAVHLMGTMAERYGFYGAGEFEGTAESLAVSDTMEAWIFHILPDPTGTSAIWAAQRVADNGFAVLANMFVIRHVDPKDTANFLMSDSVHQVAREYGWWNSSSTTEEDDDDNLLDFTKVYSDGEYAHKYYSGRRMWGAYHLAAPSWDFSPDYTDLQSDPVYPVYVPPDTKLSVQDLMRFHRYTYQGTKYDLSTGMAAGPFGSPDRWKSAPNEDVIGNWERPIGLYRTSDTYIVQSKSSSDDAILWFGPASPLGTIFTPFVVSMSDIPPSYSRYTQLEFSRHSAFWAACVVANIAQLKWNYMSADIEALQHHWESTAVQHLEEEEGESVSADFYYQHAEHIVQALWNLSDQLLFKYASGFVNEPTQSQPVGYPSWWLQQVGYEKGPPPPPTKPKCCHPSALLEKESKAILTGKVAMRQFLRKDKEES